MESREEFDFESFKKEALFGLSSSKKMSGSEGVLAPLLKHLLESALDGELEHPLNQSKAAGQPNRKNGKTSKTCISRQQKFPVLSTVYFRLFKMAQPSLRCCISLCFLGLHSLHG